jgi:hypothetical protein
MGGDYTEGERGVLARIIHEHFCCNRGFAILAREATVPVMLNVSCSIKHSLKHEIRPSTGSWRPESVEERFTRNALWIEVAMNRHE